MASAHGAEEPDAVAGVLPSPDRWAGKRVLVTGHMGFKGSWLSLWLREMGAQVTGLSDRPPTVPSLCELARVDEVVRSEVGDVSREDDVARVFAVANPEVVFHLAAQPLVRLSYEDPLRTFRSNVLGTAVVLDAVRRHPGVRVCVVVTSDKCYEDRGWEWGYRENDALGGHDPYSVSKACAELVARGFRRSYFEVKRDDAISTKVVTARAGNVVGGGDYAPDRLVPDAVRAVAAGEPLRLRHPNAVRPWQHVLDALCGYLVLAEASATRDVLETEFNFAPPPGSSRSVGWVAGRLAKEWGGPPDVEVEQADVERSESAHLVLDATRARTRLGWRNRLGIEETLAWTVGWYRSVAEGGDARALALGQIAAFGGEGDRTPGPPGQYA